MKAAWAFLTVFFLTVGVVTGPRSTTRCDPSCSDDYAECILEHGSSGPECQCVNGYTPTDSSDADPTCECKSPRKEVYGTCVPSAAEEYCIMNVKRDSQEKLLDTSDDYLSCSDYDICKLAKDETVYVNKPVGCKDKLFHVILADGSCHTLGYFNEIKLDDKLIWLTKYQLAEEPSLTCENHQIKLSLQDYEGTNMNEVVHKGDDDHLVAIGCDPCPTSCPLKMKLKDIKDLGLDYSKAVWGPQDKDIMLADSNEVFPILKDNKCEFGAGSDKIEKMFYALDNNRCVTFQDESLANANRKLVTHAITKDVNAVCDAHTFNTNLKFITELGMKVKSADEIGCNYCPGCFMRFKYDEIGEIFRGSGEHKKPDICGAKDALGYTTCLIGPKESDNDASSPGTGVQITAATDICNDDSNVFNVVLHSGSHNCYSFCYVLKGGGVSSGNVIDVPDDTPIKLFCKPELNSVVIEYKSKGIEGTIVQVAGTISMSCGRCPQDHPPV